jgi:hypothetical protein
MPITALTWPEAFVGAVSVAAIAAVLAVLIWSIFRTGQIAIKKEPGERKLLERVQADIAELRAELQRLAASSTTASGPER